MIKFEKATVLILNNDDFQSPGKLTESADQETITADIVIYEGRTVKNRFFNTDGEHKGVNDGN